LLGEGIAKDAHCKLWRGRGEARGGVRQTEKEILLYKWGGGSGGRAELGASLVARGRTLIKVTLLVTALFFFSCCPSPVTIPARGTLIPMVRSGPFPPFMCPVFTA
jgi:hypothetical protein